MMGSSPMTKTNPIETPKRVGWIPSTKTYGRDATNRFEPMSLSLANRMDESALRDPKLNSLIYLGLKDCTEFVHLFFA